MFVDDVKTWEKLSDFRFSCIQNELIFEGFETQCFAMHTNTLQGKQMFDTFKNFDYPVDLQNLFLSKN